ncbi:hypothetical protein [Bacillus cereus group sp. BfR-BA-02730]|uniref:hypothetical protein n=1 Tax=Bacillus cereus group sp. BfR-BA-02730 TaxID=3094893 RepID=UPI0029C2D6AD|nr:hypothetical protein [Bacillus cereus group sp. BfR-BA-02730]MDX5808633.1 hypothetical protein [Bacillus cereus group sp. BfR-BA-02730]
MLELTEQELQMVANELKRNVESLKEDIKKEDIQIFPSYEAFFYWLHNDLELQQCLKMLFEKKTLVDEVEFLILETGTTVYVR